jgi:hypothetical protein
VIIGSQLRPTPTEPRIARSALKPTDSFGGPNRFLFAEVGVQQNGMELSVLSMLSRQDVDPWDEAAYLSGCPTRDAVARLASRVADASIALANPRDPSEVAVDLVRLLPSRDDGLSSSLLSRGAMAHDLQFGAGGKFGGGGKPPQVRRRESGSSPNGARNPHSARLHVILFASLAGAAIMAAAPHPIWSIFDGPKPTVSATQPATTTPSHPIRWYYH